MTDNKPTTLPQSAIRLLKIVARSDDFHYAVGDLGQMYETIIGRMTPRGAWCWLWWEVLRSLPGFAKNKIYWSAVMFGNYLKTTWRSVRRQWGYFGINIAGLAIGLACSLLIMLWVQHELSFDKFHTKSERIYRSCLEANVGAPIKVPASSAPMGPAMVEEFPEVLAAVQFSGDGRSAISVGEHEYFEDDVVFAGSSYFEVFDFPLIQGDPETALEAPFTVVISESLAQKYFGNDNPMGQVLRFDGRDNYTITGILKDPPSNTHLRLNVIRSQETLVATESTYLADWYDFGFSTYLLLAEGASPIELEQKMPDFVSNRMGDLERLGVGSLRIYFQPLEDIYLQSDFGRDFGVAGSLTHVYGFTAIALFILLIACVNFVNLTTARSADREREVGLRKTFGAERSKLVGQFLCEAVLHCVAALVLALFLLEAVLPAFNNLAGCEVGLDYIAHPEIIAGLLCGAVVIGLVAGSYPAFFLSAFRPARTLRQNRASSRSGSVVRSVLVVFQFAISITLIVGALTIFRQIDYMSDKDLGFDREQILVLPNVNATITDNFASFVDQLAGLPGVTGVSGTSRLPGRGISKSFYFPEGVDTDEPQTMNFILADHAFLDLLGLELTAGRYFSTDTPTDTADAIVINETAARLIGWNDPLDRVIRTAPSGDPEPNAAKRVVGVIKDFHQYSLQNPIEPLVILCTTEPITNVALKLAGTGIAPPMEAITTVWRQFSPGRPFDYYFLDEDYDKQYRKEQRLSEIVLYFCLLAVFIGCLGLFGMASFAAQQRTKEIGIRKVLGATTPNIVTVLARQFLGQVLIANLIAWPIAYYVMSRWLDNFAYRAELGLSSFVISGLLALVAAIITVSYQAIKAASSNPIDCLRSE